MIAKIMKVFKNLFGNGSKIHADEIITGTPGNSRTLNEALNQPPVNIFTVTRTKGTESVILPGRGVYQVVAQELHGGLTLAYVMYWSGDGSNIQTVTSSPYSSITLGNAPREILIDVTNWHIITVTRLS